jgi:hypothetical protein
MEVSKMPKLLPEMEEIYVRALDELFALGRKLPWGSFRLVAEKYDIKEYTLRAKYWKRTDEKPSPFLQPKSITIGNIKFDANPFRVAEAIKLLIRSLDAAEEKNSSLQVELDKILADYRTLEKKYRTLLHQT